MPVVNHSAYLGHILHTASMTSPLGILPVCSIPSIVFLDMPVTWENSCLPLVSASLISLKRDAMVLDMYSPASILALSVLF